MKMLSLFHVILIYTQIAGQHFSLEHFIVIFKRKSESVLMYFLSYLSFAS